MFFVRLSLASLSLLLSTNALAGDISGKVATDPPADTPVVVYVERAKAPGVPAAVHRTLRQRGAAFVPDAVVVVRGETVDFPNEDKIFHNVFSVTDGNDFDLGLYRGGASKSATLGEVGEVDVYCNIHPSMVAKILVLQNHHYAEVKPDGTYSIAGVPPGSYTLVAWSAKHEPMKQTVTVTASGAKLSFKLTARKAAGPHLNKTGEQYGRYK